MASESAELQTPAEVDALAVVGKRILTNVIYSDRVADLNIEKNSYIIAYERRPGRNQVVRNFPSSSNG